MRDLGKFYDLGRMEMMSLKGLKWIEQRLGPALRTALKSNGGIDLNSILSRGLQMGDECHNRNIAASSLFARQILPSMIANDISRDVVEQIAKFFQQNDHFFLNLSMAACKAIMDSSCGIKKSTLTTIMSRNGTEFGIKISGMNEWFTAKAPSIDGLYFPGYSFRDANPDLGDSSIIETSGLGGFAMAASPAIVQFIGGSYTSAMDLTKDMYNITLGKNSNYLIPT